MFIYFLAPILQIHFMIVSYFFNSVNPKLSKIDNLITEDLNTPLELEFQDNSVLIELCGIRDQNLIFLEDKLAIQITRRGNKLSFSKSRRSTKKLQIY